jgi:hypothetical protein
MSSEGNNNSWNEWSKLVLSELDRLNKSNQELAKEIQDFKIDITAQLAKKSEVEELRNQLAVQKVETLNEAARVKEELVERINILEKGHASELARQGQETNVALAALRTDLQNKAGTWGALAGLIPVVVTLVILGIKAYIG